MFRKLTFLTCLIFLLGSVSNCWAAYTYWYNASNSNWSDTGNWYLGTMPTSADWAFIRGAATPGPVISSDDNPDCAYMAINPGWDGAGINTATLSSGTLTVRNYLSVGYGADCNATFVMLGGTLNTSTGTDAVIVGHADGSDGLFWMTGGTVNTGTLYIPASWSSAATNGDVRIMGGTFNADTLSMKAGGYMNITEGSLVLDGDDTATVNGYISSGYIKAYNGVGRLSVVYSGGKTTVTATPTRIGAIRFDSWYDEYGVEDYAGQIQHLKPAKWHYRLPFYADLSFGHYELTEDRQAVMDKEIEYAKYYGLDYWIWGYYFPGSSWMAADRLNQAMYYYLSSKNVDDVKFCLRLAGTSVGDADDWYNWMIPTIVDYMKKTSYQKVLTTRPLLYMFSPETFDDIFGSDAATAAALNALRTAATTAGLGSPYIVCMVWSGSSGNTFIDNQGYDAMTAYTAPDFTLTTVQEYPYSYLSAGNVSFWNDCYSTGEQVIPIVNVGWDQRPVEEGGERTPIPWYTQPTKTQWKNHLTAAFNWNQTYPASTEVDHVIIYAWDEITEGGWIVPSWSQGTTYLEGLKEAAYR